MTVPPLWAVGDSDKWEARTSCIRGQFVSTTSAEWPGREWGRGHTRQQSGSVVGQSAAVARGVVRVRGNASPHSGVGLPRNGYELEASARPVDHLVWTPIRDDRPSGRQR